MKVCEKNLFKCDGKLPTFHKVNFFRIKENVRSEIKHYFIRMVFSLICSCFITRRKILWFLKLCEFAFNKERFFITRQNYVTHMSDHGTDFFRRGYC